MKLESLLESFLMRGDGAAMREFVRRTRPRLLRIARRIGAAQDADDSVQAAYHALLARAPIDAPCEAWLVTAVVRIAYRHKAVSKRQHDLAQRLDRPRATPTPLMHLTREETRRIVRRAVTALPGKYRDVIVLHHLEGLSTQEIAPLLGIARSTVTTRLHRGRALLRHNLPPRLIHGALFLPWLFRDLAGAGASGLGVIMQTKTIATVVVVGLAAGATGYGAATLTDASKLEPTRAHGHERTIRELEARLARSQERARTLQRSIEARQGKPAPAERAPAAPAPRARPVAPIGVREAAHHLEVAPAALATAIQARQAIARNADDMFDRIRDLKHHGEAGFRAALAIVRGTHNVGQPEQKLLDETFLVGLENLLLDTIDSKRTGYGARQIAVRTLRHADTPAVRDYLLEKLDDHKNPGLFWSVAMTLGDLAEPRAAPAVGRVLLFDEPVEDAKWSRLRVGLLAHLAKMGGEDAPRILREFLSDERATRGAEIVQALDGLAQFDRPACGELAHRILQEPRGMALSKRDADLVRRFLRYRR